MNCGPAAARNAGLAAAAGSSWVAFLDNDDLWGPTKVELQLAALAATPQARWSATSCVHVRADLRVRWAARLPQGPLSSAKEMLVSSTEMLALLNEDQRVPAGCSPVLASRKLVLDIGNFNRDADGCEDWDLWLRLTRESPLAYVDLPLVAYRVWDGQASANVRAQVRSASVLRQPYFPECGAPPHGYVARWEQKAARRHVAGRRRGRAAYRYLWAAWAGRQPGQLAYALAAVTAPTLVEKRLQRIERTRCLPDGWEEAVEPWLSSRTEQAVRSVQPRGGTDAGEPMFVKWRSA